MTELIGWRVDAEARPVVLGYYLLGFTQTMVGILVWIYGNWAAGVAFLCAGGCFLTVPGMMRRLYRQAWLTARSQLLDAMVEAVTRRMTLDQFLAAEAEREGIIFEQDE